MMFQAHVRHFLRADADMGHAAGAREVDAAARLARFERQTLSLELSMLASPAWPPRLSSP